MKNSLRSTTRRGEYDDFQKAVKTCLSKYVTFTGREPANRARASSGYGWVYLLAVLGLFLPSLAVGIGRLHDGNRSGWWWLIALTGIGAIVLLVWFMQKSTTGENRYVSDPLGGDLSATFA